MKRILLISISGLLTFSVLRAQEIKFDWHAQFDGQVEVKATETDKSGAIYHLVNFINTVDFDPGDGVLNLTAKGSNDLALLKFSDNRTLLWAYQIGGLSNDGGRDIVLDNDANIYLAGTFRGRVNFGGSGSSFFMTSVMGTSSASTDGFICKIDSSGQFQWSSQMGGSDSDWVTAIALNKSEELIVTGAFTSEMDFQPTFPSQPFYNPVNGTSTFIAKYSISDGAWITGSYIHPVHLTNDDPPIRVEPKALMMDAASNFYITGYFNTHCDFDLSTDHFNLTSFYDSNNPPRTSYNDDIFIVKYDSDFKFKWAKQLGGWDTDRPTDIILDYEANIYMVGSTANFNNETDFDPGENFHQIDDRNVRTFVAKYDSSGSFRWVNPYSGAGTVLIANEIEINEDGSLLVAGVFTGLTDFDLGEDESSIEPVSDQSVFLLNLTTTGDYLNVSRFIGGVAGTNITPILHHDKGNSIYVSGTFAGSYDFDPSTEVQMFSTSSSTSPAGFLVKLKECGNTESFISVSSCDSYTMNSEVFTATGTYEQIIPNHIGCDSLITLDLTINPTYEETFERFLCPDGPFLFGSQSLTMTGDYSELFQSSFGCDSLVHLTLTEKEFDLSVSVDGANLKANASGDEYQWVNCDDNSEIAGATQQTYTPLQSGSYAVFVTDANCEFLSECAEIIVLGTAKNHQEFISAYPNPVKSTFKLTLPFPLRNGVINIKNISGQQIFKKTGLSGDLFEFNISQLPNGVYFLEIDIGKEKKVVTLVKQ